MERGKSRSEIPPVFEEVVDLRQYWQTIVGHRWIIFGLVLICTLAAGLLVQTMPPVYRATATLLIEAEQPKAVSIEDVYGLDSSRDEYYLTQFEILKSRQLAEKVVQRMGLVSHPEFVPEPKPRRFDVDIRAWLPFLSAATPTENSTEQSQRLRREAVINKLMNQVSIEPIRKTQLVDIEVESLDPQLAADIANTYGNVYIENHLEAKMLMTRKATDWLNGQLAVLSDRVEQSEASLQQYQEQEQLLDVDGVQSLTTQQLNQLNSQLLEARSLRTSVESTYRLVRQQGENDIDSLSDLPEILDHRLIQSVRESQVEADRKVSELAKRYGPKHPRMIAARAELETIEQSLAQQIRKQIAGIERDYRAALANERAIQGELDRVKQQFQENQRKENQFLQLKREVDTNRELYQTFLTRLKETDVAGGFEAANARFTDQAVTPRKPVKPQKKMVLAVAFAASLMLGVILAFLLDALNDTFNRAEDIEQKLGVRLLGMVPLVKLKKRDAYVPLESFAEDWYPGFSESIRTLRTGYVLSHLDQQAKLVAVTSSVPAEGKTTVAENLAFALGQMEKVLLIDADMRRPSIGGHFGLADHLQPGLSDAIGEVYPLNECIYRESRLGIDVMSAGHIPANPLELLSSARFEELLEELSQRYDRIVIDTPPVQAVSDTLVVAQLVESLIYVVRSAHTRQRLVKQGIARLHQVASRIDGVVLNQINIRKASQYDYYDGYYDRYGYGKQGRAAKVMPLSKDVA